MTDEASLNATRKIVRYSLLASLFLILVLAFVVFRPFILTFAVAASASLLLAPVHDRLTRALGGRHSLAAALLVVLCTVMILPTERRGRGFDPTTIDIAPKHTLGRGSLPTAA